MAGSSELELVTGYRGKAHVTADDARSYNAGTIGKGTYVLPEGDELAAEMVDSNTLRVRSGTLLAQGCQCRVRAGEYVDVKIRNGSQSMKRNDIVVARYEKQAAEPKTESMTLKVIEGTPTDGTATDPGHVEGDILAGDLVAEFPLWRIPLDGIAVGMPVPLYKKLVTLDSLGDSVSRTDWTYLYGEPGNGKSFVRYRREGARCALQWGVTQGTSAYWAAGRLPEQMRPRDGTVYVPGVCTSPDGTVENVCAYCYVSASTGEVGLQLAVTTNRNVWNHGETSWVI